MATLTLDHVSKTYLQKGHEPTRAVIDFSLSMDDAEIVGLVGSSGCGKTSTLRMVAGFESVSEGTVRLGDRVLNNLKPADRNVAMAFETYALYPPLKVADNIAFSLLRNKMPRARAHEKVRSIADLLEIGDILDLYPPTLSGGQQQRVSLARALVRPADLFLLDEPMSQLEPHLRAKLRARIKDYLIEHKMTAVFVTHDQTEAMALADRIAVMDAGLLQQYGSPVDLKERPANLFVASFIGEPPRNLLKATVAVEGGARRIVVQNERGENAFSFGLPAADGLQPLHNGRRIHLGVRPHKITLGEHNGHPAAQVKGTVLSSQWLGDQSYLGVDVGGCILVVVADRGVQAAVDSTVVLGLQVEALHFFDGDSGKAILHGTDLATPAPARRVEAR